MKKVLFAAFAGVCILSSVMGTHVPKGTQHMREARVRQFVTDTVPGKSDTSRWPKKDTTSMPRIQTMN